MPDCRRVLPFIEWVPLLHVYIHLELVGALAGQVVLPDTLIQDDCRAAHRLRRSPREAFVSEKHTTVCRVNNNAVHCEWLLLHNSSRISVGQHSPEIGRMSFVEGWLAASYTKSRAEVARSW